MLSVDTIIEYDDRVLSKRYSHILIIPAIPCSRIYYAIHTFVDLYLRRHF